MVRVWHETLGFVCPCFADSFVRREASQGLEARSEIVGRDEVGKMLPKLVVRLVIVALDGRLLWLPPVMQEVSDRVG